LAW
ncbi:bacterial extracellular solute-binding s, 3 family protein, partial [Vibrio parahaemolyticus V-223/04]|jgi:hypothetical protein